MSDLTAELYQMVRNELQNTHIPMIKKAMNELDTASEKWTPKISKLSAEVNSGTNEKMVEAMKEAAAAMDKHEKVLSDMADKLKEWKELFERWSRPDGPP